MKVRATVFTQNEPQGVLLPSLASTKNVDSSCSKETINYQSLFESLDDVVLQTDYNGRILLINPSSESFFGLSPEEMTGNSISDFYYHPVQRLHFMQELKRNGVVRNYTASFKTRCGKIKTGSINAKAVFNKNAAIESITGTIREVAEVDNEARDLQNTKEFYETILHSIPEDIAVFDEANRYRFLNWNAIKNDELRAWMIGKDDYEFCAYTKRDVSLAKERLSYHGEVNRTGEKIEWIEELKDKNGQQRYILRILKPFTSAQGQRYKVGYGLDITELKTIELKLAESESYLRSLLTSLPDIIFRINDKGQFIDYKVDHEDRLTIKPEVFLGKSMYELWPEPVASFHMQFIHQAFATGKLVTYEYPRTDNQGHTVFYEGRVIQKSETEVLVVIRDISEKKEQEEEYKRLQAALLQEQKKRQKKVTEQVIEAQEKEREIIGRELHDNVNQILTTVKLYVESALIDPAMQDRLLPRSMELVQASINEIRKLSKELSAPTLGNITLVDSIAELIQQVTVASTLNIELDIEDFREDQIHKNKKLAIYRIIQEQINNTIKYANANLLTITLKEDGQRLQLCLQDDGIGFDLSAPKKGIGLQNIINRVEAYQGEVQIETAPGKGVHIRISFPLL